MPPWFRKVALLVQTDLAFWVENWMMVAVGLVTRQHRDASQEVGVGFRAFLYVRADVPAVTSRATFCEAFSCAGGSHERALTEFRYGW